MEKLAIEGGTPVRSTLLPYGRQYVDETDIQAVVKVLSGDWLTTGPLVAEFEAAFATRVNASQAVAVSSGTAALHLSMAGLGIGPEDEVIVPPMTFAATANCVVFQGGSPVFADVEPGTLLLDPVQVEAKITGRTKAIIAVDYAGQPCHYEALQDIAKRYGLALVDDACHALGGGYKGEMVGTLANLNTFSLHPVKHITTGEGGVITTDDPELAERMQILRNHGITSDHHQRAKQGLWFYEMVDLGYNYRLTDLQCALGLSQLQKLPQFVERRQAIAHIYDDALTMIPEVSPLKTLKDRSHAYHLYVIQLNLESLQVDRNQIFAALRAEGIGVNVHYIPIHLHPYYQRFFKTKPGDYPVAEAAYERILSLPIFPTMSDDDINDVITAVDKVISVYRSNCG